MTPGGGGPAADACEAFAWVGHVSIGHAQMPTERVGDESIPWFDPTGAGTAARILLLLEARARGWRRALVFISPDNDDGNAQNMWEPLREVGMDRGREIVTWNAIPWYLGTGRAIRAARSSDIEEAHQARVELVALLPQLRVVVLLGKAAQRAWSLVGVELRVPPAPHPPSP